MSKFDSVQLCIDRLDSVLTRLDGCAKTEISEVRDILAAISQDRTPVARVLVMVSGGIADYVFEGPVSVEVFDFDNYFDDPQETGLPSEEFTELAKCVASIAALYPVEIPATSGPEGDAA